MGDSGWEIWNSAMKTNLHASGGFNFGRDFKTFAGPTLFWCLRDLFRVLMRTAISVARSDWSTPQGNTFNMSKHTKRLNFYNLLGLSMFYPSSQFVATSWYSWDAVDGTCLDTKHLSAPSSSFAHRGFLVGICYLYILQPNCLQAARNTRNGWISSSK